MAEGVGTAAVRASGARWLVLLPPVATLVLVLVDLGAASDGFTAGGSDAFTLAFLLWNLSPGLAMLVLAVLAATRHRGTRTALVGGLVLLLVTAALVWSIRSSASSTAAVGYVTSPLAGWTVVAVTGALLLVARGRTSR